MVSFSVSVSSLTGGSVSVLSPPDCVSLTTGSVGVEVSLSFPPHAAKHKLKREISNRFLFFMVKPPKAVSS